MTRGGRAKARDESERRCIVTRATGPKAGLIRFVAGPDDAIVPDLAERLLDGIEHRLYSTMEAAKERR